MKTKSIFLSTFIIFQFYFFTLAAQEDVWNRIQPTPQEHSLSCIRQIPGTETIVAVGNGSTIMYSEDEGESWDITLNPAGLPNNTLFLSVNFYDEQNGYAAANFGQVIRTTDGGETWELIYDNVYDSLRTSRVDIYLLNEETAIVVGFDRLILKTNDGGNSWSTTISPEEFLPNSIDFLDQDTGHIVGRTDENIALKTTDKGETWNTSPLPAEHVPLYYDIHFMNASEGIISAGSYTSVVIYKTEDSGDSWIQVYTSENYSVGEIDFMDALNGAIRIPSWTSSFLYTGDGGNTWAPDYDDFFYNYTPCYSFIYNQAFMMGVGRFGNIGRLYSNEDEWEQLAEKWGANKCRNALFTSSQIGYCQHTNAGGGVPGGALRKTENGGHSWHKVFGSVYYGSFDFVDDYIGFLCGDDWDGQKFYSTTNGGNSWNEIYDFGEVDLYYDQPVTVEFLDSLNGVVAFMWKSFITDDGGHTWENLLTLRRDFDEIYSVDYLSEDTIFLSCLGYSYPVVFKSFDGGATFGSDTLDHKYFLADKVFFQDHSTGFLLVNRYEHDTGFIYKTTNGGESWYQTVINDTTYSSNKNIFFSSEDIGYVVGSGSYTTMLKTSDGGETWDPIDIPCSSGLSHVHFHDDWHGFVFGNNGVIMETLTGGVVGIDDNPYVGRQEEVTIYPNPAKDFIQIKLEEQADQNTIIEVFDLKGKCILKKNIPGLSSQKTVSINVTTLPTGVYYCRLRNGNSISTSKIVKL